MTFETPSAVRDIDDLRAAHAALRAGHLRTAADLRAAKEELATSRTARDQTAKAHAQALADLSAKHGRELETIRHEHHEAIGAATRLASDQAQAASEVLADLVAQHDRELEAVRQEHRDVTSAAARLALSDAQAASQRLADLSAERDFEVETIRREHQVSAEAARRRFEAAQKAIAEQEARSAVLEEAVEAAQKRTDALMDERSGLLTEAVDLRKAHEVLRSELATEKARASAAQLQAEHTSRDLGDQAELARASAAASLALEREESAARLERQAADHAVVLAHTRASADEEIRTISKSLEISQQALAAVLASTSWRMTRPLRSIAFRVNRLVRG